jgi:hypothetical protein
VIDIGANRFIALSEHAFVRVDQVRTEPRRADGERYDTTTVVTSPSGARKAAE